MVHRRAQRHSWEIRASSHVLDDHEVVTGKSVPVEESTEEISTLLAWADPKGNDRILDAGAGSGRLCVEIESKASQAEIIALDFSHGMLRRLKATGSRAQCVVADILNLPFRPRAFTLVLCVGVLSSLPTPDRSLSNLRQSIAAVDELKRIIKVGGRLCVDFGNIVNPSWIIGHIYDSLMSRIWPTSRPIFQYAITLAEAESILSKDFRITEKAAFDYAPIPIHRRLLPSTFADGLVKFWRKLGRFICPRSRLAEFILPVAYTFKVVKKEHR